jgi:hypothetical protein
MDHDEMIYQLKQAAISFRHQAEWVRKINNRWPNSIPENTADYHASQLEKIIEHLSTTAPCDTN